MATAKTKEEFNEQARKFVARAKEAGVSNTAIYNTLQFKWNEFESTVGNRQLADVDGDGVMEWVNPQTGEISSTGFDMAGGLDDLNNINDPFDPSLNNGGTNATYFDADGNPVNFDDPKIVEDFITLNNTPQMEDDNMLESGKKDSSGTIWRAATPDPKEEKKEDLPQAGTTDQYGRKVTGSGQGYYNYQDASGSGTYVNKDILPNIAGKGTEFLKEAFIPLYSAKKRGLYTKD